MRVFRTVSTAILGVLAGGMLTAEIPAFLPELPARAPLGPVAINRYEVAPKLPDGVTVKVGDFLSERSLNGDWKISKLERSAQPFPDDVDLDKGYEKPDFDDSGWDSIMVPLDWYRQYPKTYLRNEPYVKGTYRHSFELSEAELRDRRVILHFGVIGYDGTVFVNGQRVGRHQGDFTPYDVDITPYVKVGKNVISIRVLTDFGTTHGNVPKAKHVYGSQWGWGNIKGGLWQPVSLRFVPRVHFSRMLISPLFGKQAVLVDYTIMNTTEQALAVELNFAVSGALKKEANKFNTVFRAGRISLKPGENSGTVEIRLDNPVAWSPDNPHLYFLTGFLTSGDQILSADAARFGFREFRIRDGKFHLNGKRIYLFGENIRSVDFGGRNTTPEEDYRNLHKFLAGFKRQGVNIIRNAHLPILPMALEIADEIGLMIYDEWGWSFTKFIDEPEFQKNNDRELREFLLRDYNHPAVVMWSGANEVVHRDNPEVKRQLDRQVDIIRDFDKSGRPVGVFSGSASWNSYGTAPLNTDFLDLHNYHGLSARSWTEWNESLNSMYNGSLKHYGVKGDVLPWPYIIWECVGFTWGSKLDAKFTLNDIRKYAKYARSDTSWAQGNGIGYAGTIGLAAALDPKRGLDYGKALFGHRMLELARQNPRIDGFAPWQHAYNLPMAALWNQPVLIGVRGANGLPPSNLFAGARFQRELFVVNSTNEAVKDAVAKLWIRTEAGQDVPLAELAVPEVKPWSIGLLPIDVELPREALKHVQLRVELLKGTQSLSRNFYPVFLQDPAVLSTPVPVKEKIALLDVGSRDDVSATAKILAALKIPYTVIPADALTQAFSAAIIPAGLSLDRNADMDFQKVEQWMRQGGKLLILEQNAGVGRFFPQFSMLVSPLAFADIVYTEHPVFAGLDQRNFDLWENPESGRVIENSIAPFSTNALAVRGPLLGAQNVSNAVLEATAGKGRVYWTQLCAVKNWGRDSAASTYLVNVLRYMFGGDPRFPQVTELEVGLPGRQNYEIPEGREVFIDLSKHANQGFTDDGKGGGWTGQKGNDFRNMPVGIQSVGRIRFNIIDPAKNGGKSCLVLRGTEKPDFPVRIDGIPVNAKLTRLFFLHATAWKGEDAGRYRINYADGTRQEYILQPGRNVTDWWNADSYLPDAVPGIMRPNLLSEQVGTFMAVWENPYPEKTIRSIDFLSAGAESDINYLPGKCPVPILVAVTGERLNTSPLRLSGQWFGGGRDGVKPAVVREVETTLADGKPGKATRVEFPAVSQPEGFAYAMFRYDPTGFDLEKYRYFTFMVKVEKTGTIDINIPERRWQGYFRGSFEMDDRYKQWRKIRIDLKNDMKGASTMSGKTLRNELFFYNALIRTVDFPRPAVTLTIYDLRFE